MGNHDGRIAANPVDVAMHSYRQLCIHAKAQMS